MLRSMFQRQKTGSVVCASCGSLVGVNDETCYSCGRRNPGLWGYGPMLRRFGNDLGFVTLVVYGSIALYFATLATTVVLGGNIMPSASLGGILAPDPRVALAFGASGAYPLFTEGMWWTVLSAGWLHGGALHIFFNMMWVRQLGPATADIYGAGRMVIIYTTASVVGFLLSSLGRLLLVVGADLVPSGGHAHAWRVGADLRAARLTGVLRPPRRQQHGRRSRPGNTPSSSSYFGLIMPGVDNYAHAGGFVGGYLASVWLDPLKRERMDHFLYAIACLVATALAVVASLITILPDLIQAARSAS